jgi:hypothetical protein
MRRKMGQKEQTHIYQLGGLKRHATVSTKHYPSTHNRKDGAVWGFMSSGM